MKTTASRVVRGALGSVLLVASSIVSAADWQFTGLLREEVAAPIDNQVNPQNQQGKRFQWRGRSGTPALARSLRRD